MQQLKQLNQLQQSSSSKNPFHTLVIEAWLSALTPTPSLIAHNLELQGIQLPHSVTITIDRGHYDCAGVSYAVIGVRSKSPIAFNLHHNPTTQKNSFYCSFFSQKVTPGSTDPTVLNQHWLGNCCVFLGADFETHASQFSYRHESGHVKTWRKIDPEADQMDEPEADLSEDAVSVGPTNPSPKRANANANAKIKFNALNAKDNLRIIQLQKKNVALRTELGAMKSELDSLKAELGAVKADMCAQFGSSTNLVQRLNEQEVWIKRANQCMQDWTNRQVIERVWMLETQHAQLRSEHLKQKEQQQQKHLEQQLKKQHAQHESVCAEMLERLTHLESNMNAINPTNLNECNKCNENYNNCNPNPFDFSTIYDHYNKTHYLDGGPDECPALDLIANHYADFDTATAVASAAAVATSAAVDDNQDDDDPDDDDMFELIQIDHSFNFPSVPGPLSK